MSNEGATPELQTGRSGIVFICTGEFYTDRALEAAESVRRSNPRIPMVLFTDQTIRSELFVSIERITDPHMRSKIDYLDKSPFDLTLYLDTDVRVIGDISDMFGLLEKYEMAGAHVRARAKPRRLKSWRLSLPRTFPQINCGVLLYKKCEATSRLFRDWQAAYREAKLEGDQLTFRETLWRSDVKFYVLAPEYNMRSSALLTLLSKEPRPVILHKRSYHFGRWVLFKNWLKTRGRPGARPISARRQ
ncbi:MAG: hypothetical protein AB7S92_03300 [Parvibaculaceae bacterium]